MGGWPLINRLLVFQMILRPRISEPVDSSKPAGEGHLGLQGSDVSGVGRSGRLFGENPRSRFSKCIATLSRNGGLRSHENLRCNDDLEDAAVEVEVKEEVDPLLSSSGVSIVALMPDSTRVHFFPVPLLCTSMLS